MNAGKKILQYNIKALIRACFIRGVISTYPMIAKDAITSKSILYPNFRYFHAFLAAGNRQLQPDFGWSFGIFGLPAVFNFLP